jgi:hypothetical protein
MDKPWKDMSEEEQTNFLTAVEIRLRQMGGTVHQHHMELIEIRAISENLEKRLWQLENPTPRAHPA